MVQLRRSHLDTTPAHGGGEIGYFRVHFPGRIARDRHTGHVEAWFFATHRMKQCLWN